MSIYAISDLHLPLGVEKPMDIFGKRWENYVERLKENWEKTVTEEDYVIIPGDVSWATYLSESIKDFEFINSLPGTKLISKGNHDYWWTTAKKLNEFKMENNLDTIIFLQNDSYIIDKTAVCACRGWITPEDKKFTAEDEKIYKRELLRMNLSLKDAVNKGCEDIILAIHYPPLGEFLECLKEYNIKSIVYGHLHHEEMEKYSEILPLTHLVSADYLSFLPKKI